MEKIEKVEKVEKKITVSNRAGLHARPSAMVVELIKNYKSDIHFETQDDRINAKSIMGLLTLCAAYGTEIKIIAEGEDAEAAVEVIVRLFESKFEEGK
jgi:phosphocarrier protein